MQVWSYDPAMRDCRLESSKTNRMLMRRYAVVEKAKDADVIGILVGTLGVGASGHARLVAFPLHVPSVLTHPASASQPPTSHSSLTSAS
jgi:hypothetical protein